MNSNGLIKAPISLKDDVYTVLGISPSGAYYDLAEACSSDKINKWSKYKPIVPITDKYTPLTEADIQERHCGLKPVELNSLWSSCSHIEPATYKDVRPLDEILSSIREWDYYYKPSLANNNWFRLTDFSNALDPKGEYGYIHDALPSDKDWDGYTKTRLDLDLVAWENVDQNLVGTNAYDFTIQNSIIPLESFSINLDNDYGYIGEGNDKMLPLTDAVGSGVIENEYWRIAYAVQIPYHSTSDSTPTNEWYLFIGRSPLKDVTNTTLARLYFAPHMGSNTLAIQLMLANNRDKGISNFRMIPCLVKNARLNKETTDGTNYRNWVYLDTSSKIYALPSGAGSSALYFRVTKEDENIPRIDGLTGIVKYGEYEDAWVLGYVWRDQAGSYGAPIQQAVVARAVELPSGSNWSGVVKIGLQYHLLDTDTGEDLLISHPSGYESGYVVDYEITSADTVSITDGNGEAHSYPGIVLDDLAGPGFYFTPDQVVTFKIEIN